MPLWGTTASSADNKPKYLVDDENSEVAPYYEKWEPK